MQYNININQKSAIDAGLIADVIDLCIFDFLQKFTGSKLCKRMSDNDRQYFSVSYSKVITELPIIGIKTSDGIYRRFKRLELSGLIDFHPDNAKNNMVWFCWGRNYDKMFFTPGQPSEGSDENKDTPRMGDRTPPDEKPKHYYTLLLYPCSILTLDDAQKAKRSIKENPLMIENFCRVRQLAKERYDECLDAFEIEISTSPQRYESYGKLSAHFLNFSETRCRIADEKRRKNHTTPGANFARPASNKMRTIEVREHNRTDADQLF